MNELGLKALAYARGDVMLGAALSLASMAIWIAAMSLADIFTPFFRLSLSDGLSRTASALLTAISSSTIEKFFCGIFFNGLHEDLGRLPGCLLVGFFFSAPDFVRPADEIILTHADPSAGIPHLANAFHPFLDPVAILPEFVELFLIGVVSCYACERTATLYLSIGLHGGWIFGPKTVRVFCDYARQDLGWLFGSSDPKIVSGVATWLGIALVGLIIHQQILKRVGLVPDRLPTSDIIHGIE